MMRTLLALALAATLGTTAALAAQTPSDAQLQQSLQDTAAKVLMVIKQGKPADLPGYLSSKGVVLGVDRPSTPPATIANEIARKTGAYCGFFDTTCLRREDAAARRKFGDAPPSQPIYCYRDRLASGSIERVQVGPSGRSVVGLVTIMVKNAGGLYGLVFVLENGAWKLADVPQF